MYLASGTSKLVDPDWFGGLVLWDRVVRYQHVLDPFPVPGLGHRPPDQPGDSTTWWRRPPSPPSCSSGIALWRRRTRIGGDWVAVLFHVAIEISASVEVFSYVAIAALAIWVTASTRDRTVRVRPGSSGAAGLAVAVRGDWFGRFRLEPAGPGGPTSTVVDRDGTVLTGRAAAVLVLSRLPLTFLFAAPFLLARAAAPSPRPAVP